MGSASGAVMCHCSFPLSLSLFPRCYSTLNQFYFSFPPGYYSTFNSVVFHSFFFFYLTTFLNAALVLILFPFVPANSLGDGNKSRLAWLRQTSGDVDGWWGIYRITGGVGWLIGFALRTWRITVGRCEMMGWCIAQPSLMKRRKWTWTMVLQASISLPFTSVAACLCVPGALPEFKKRTQLFLDKNKLAIAVQSCFCRTCRHKHTAAKYSCHSNLFCMQNLVIYDMTIALYTQICYSRY